LAGGLNLYGFAGGDPVNYADPFGLAADLKIVGERLAAEIAELRSANPSADSVFRALEQSSEKFVLFDSDETSCDVCVGAGWAWDSSDAVGLAGSVGEQFGGARGVAHVRPSHGQSKQYGVGGVAWHEAVHLKGIVDRNSKYSHCEAAFSGVPLGCVRSP
jgi:hypothetical protein